MQRIIFDGGSTFMKWCEFADRIFATQGCNQRRRRRIQRQKEWRERNRLFKDVITRLHALPINKVYFTFHLKDNKQYADLGNGQKGLMKIGETRLGGRHTTSSKPTTVHGSLPKERRFINESIMQTRPWPTTNGLSRLRLKKSRVRAWS